MYRDIPTIDEMAKDLPQHINFYVRGVFNSILPEFLNPMSSTIRAEDVSGEMLEALRFIAKNVAPNLQEGEMVSVDYDAVQNLFKENSVLEDFQIESIGDQIRTSLGQFGLAMRDGQYVVIDSYDFEDYVGNNIRDEGGVPVFEDYFNAARKAGDEEGMYGAARVMGGYFMPENPDKTSRDDVLRVNIKIPKEPEVIETEFDNDPQAENFVFRGAMTTKRKSIFDRIFGGSEADGSASVTVGSVPTPAPRPQPEQIAMANQEDVVPTDEQASNMRFG